MYGENPNKLIGASTQDSLADQTGSLVNRLRDIHERVVNLGDNIFGPTPRSAQGAENKPEPQPSIRRHVDLAHQMVADIFNELDRITARM